MNDIKDLLISRISDIKVLIQQQPLLSHSFEYLSQKPSSKASLHCPHPKYVDEKNTELNSQSRQSSTHADGPLQKPDSQRNLTYQRINRFSALIKKREKTRNYKQQKLFNSLNMLSFHNDRQVQQLYFHFIDIFASFDQDFAKYKNPAHFLTLSMGENLKKVFSFFFLKHQQPQKCKELIPEIMARQICDLSPAFFLGSIRKWSMSILSGLLNLNEDKNECKIDIKVDLKKIQDKILNRNFLWQPYAKEEKNTFNFIRKNKSPRQSLQKPSNQVNQKKSFSFRTIVNNLMNLTNEISPQISVNSKQMVYAYCLDDLKKYYKNLPLEDLDINYLRNIKKVGRKQDLFSNQNIKNTVQVLTETKNSQIKILMTDFQSQYAKFKSNHPEFKVKTEPKESPQQQTKISNFQNKILSHERNSELGKRSLKDLSIQNLKSLFDLNSKLLTPSHNQRESYKNRIKYNHIKNEEILCENLTELTDQLEKKASHSSFVDRSKLIDYSGVLTQQITQETTHIENKIKLLKRINKKNKDLKQKLNEVKKKAYFQERNPQNEGTQCFVDQHIEPNQKISKLPKIISREKTIQNRGESPQDFQVHKNYSVQKRNKQFSIEQYRLNKSSISKEHHLIFKEQNRASQQFTGLAPWKSIVPDKPVDLANANRRFLSEAAEKQSADNASLDDNERPLSNFSFKSKAFGGSKKSSFNAMKITKSKNPIKNESKEMKNVETIHEKIKNKFGLRENTTFDMKPAVPSNIFSNQKGFQGDEGVKDDFIRYLKNLQNEKYLSQKAKCSPSKQKERSMRRKFT